MGLAVRLTLVIAQFAALACAPRCCCFRLALTAQARTETSTEEPRCPLCAAAASQEKAPAPAPPSCPCVKPRLDEAPPAKHTSVPHADEAALGANGDPAGLPAAVPPPPAAAAELTKAPLPLRILLCRWHL